MYTLVIDIESTGVELYKNDITCVGVYDSKKNKYFKFTPERFIEYWKQKDLSEYEDVVGHNCKFDRKFLYVLGVDVKFTWDTGLYEYMKDTSNTFVSLKKLAQYTLGVEDWNVKDIASKSTDNTYLKKDLQYTYEIYESQKLRNYNQKLWKHIMNASNTYAIIEATGVPIDIEQVKKLQETLRIEINDLTVKLNSVAEINWDSATQIKKVLYDDLEIEPKVFTPKGAPSTNKEALESLDHPVAKILVSKRKATKKIQFLDSWLSLEIGGRLYPTFHLNSTVTGRTSCSNPNFQQIPRDKEMRKLFISNEGYKFVEIDYSQIELRVAGIVFKDKHFISNFRNGVDMHEATAKASFNVTEVDKETRVKAKGINFGMLYGMGSGALSSTIGSTVKEAQALINNYFSHYTGIRDSISRIIEQTKNDGYYESIFGRREYFDYNASRKAPNFAIQSSASDILLNALCEICVIDGVEVYGTIHDSIIMGIKDDEEYQDRLEKVKCVMLNNNIFEKFNVEQSLPLDIGVSEGGF